MSWSYAYVFLQSNILEVVIYSLCYHKFMSWRKVLIIATAANSITHPVVFFGFMQSPLTYLTAILAAEAFAIIAETFLHNYGTKVPLRKTLPAAALANLFSWQVAPVMTYFFVFS